VASTVTGMTVQLRRYRIKPGRVAQFAQEWRAEVAPLREAYGFRVHGWLVDDDDEFIWLLEHQDRASFEAADAAYYASAERQALRPDPARLIDEARTDWVSVVL
jgi:heme-degrading monooxygenase HmoA